MVKGKLSCLKTRGIATFKTDGRRSLGLENKNHFTQESEFSWKSQWALHCFALMGLTMFGDV